MPGHTPGQQTTAIIDVGKNGRGTWCVYFDGQVISDHRTRDGAATAANNLIRAEQDNGSSVQGTDQ